MPDRNGSRCSHAASGRAHHAAQYFCMLHVQAHAHLHAAGPVYAGDARGHCRTEGILSDRAANPERTQAGRARIHPSARGHQVRSGRARALMYRGRPDHHRRRSSRSKHLWAATGLPADNWRRGRLKTLPRRLDGWQTGRRIVWLSCSSSNQPIRFCSGRKYRTLGSFCQFASWSYSCQKSQPGIWVRFASLHPEIVIVENCNRYLYRRDRPICIHWSPSIASARMASDQCSFTQSRHPGLLKADT